MRARLPCAGSGGALDGPRRGPLWGKRASTWTHTHWVSPSACVDRGKAAGLHLPMRPSRGGLSREILVRPVATSH